MGALGVEMGAYQMDNKKKIEIKKALKKNLALDIKTLEVRAAPLEADKAFSRGKAGW